MAPRQTPDHVLRDSLRTKENLRDFLESALPDQVAHFDFARVEELPREFFTGDWREREADLIFEVGYNLAGQTEPAVVGVLVEHQTNTDPHLPFRALFMLVNYWERRLRQHEQATAEPRPTFRLPPVFCVVLYTADRAWGSNVNVRQLLGEPQALHQFAPDWGPQFWNLAARSADDLLAGPAWMQLMAVVRVAYEAWPEFERVLTEVNRHLGPLAETANSRWSQLMRAVYSYSTFRRPASEHPQIREIVERENPTRVEEVREMEKTIAQAIEERGEERGERRGKIESARTTVRAVLDERFGPLPEAVTQRLDALDDLDKLIAAARLAARITKLDDFQP